MSGTIYMPLPNIQNDSPTEFGSKILCLEGILTLSVCVLHAVLTWAVGSRLKRGWYHTQTKFLHNSLYGEGGGLGGGKGLSKFGRTEDLCH